LTFLDKNAQIMKIT